MPPVADNTGGLSQVEIVNEDQFSLINRLSEVFSREPTEAELLEKVKASVPVGWLIAKDVQECYDIFIVIKAELVKREV